jgi:MraZ protein
MPLTGTYSRNLDEKFRLAVPKPLREEFSPEELTHLYVAPGTDRSLVLYSPAGFERLAQLFAQQSPNLVKAQNYLRLFYSRAEKVDLDAQGRIRLPERLVEFAQLKHDVMLLGVHDHAEIWDNALWQQFLAHVGPAFDDMAHSAFGPVKE